MEAWLDSFLEGEFLRVALGSFRPRLRPNGVGVPLTTEVEVTCLRLGSTCLQDLGSVSQ